MNPQVKQTVTATSSGGSGFCGLLTIALVVLKLTGFINWSWIWVFSPLWIGFALFFAIIALVLAAVAVGYGIVVYLDHRAAKKHRARRAFWG
jgi:ABC-type antimicrobial peptide transport system permease subunit